MTSTLINFKEPHAVLTEYKSGDIPTRENFISFIIFSFAISRGQPALQQMYFKWLENTTSFPCQEMLDNFVEEGAFDALSHEEQKRFKTAFVSVKLHTEKFIEDEFEDEWKIELNAINGRDARQTFCDNIAKTFFNFDTIKSFSDFKEAAAKYLNRNN